MCPGRSEHFGWWEQIISSRSERKGASSNGPPSGQGNLKTRTANATKGAENNKSTCISRGPPWAFLIPINAVIEGNVADMG